MNAILQNAWEATKRAAWRVAVRTLRKAVDAADEWTHAQEVALRAALAPPPAPDPAVDRKASAAREREWKKIAGVSSDGCSSVPITNRHRATGAAPHLSAERMGRRRQAPRLVYQHGEFVRREA